MIEFVDDTFVKDECGSACGTCCQDDNVACSFVEYRYNDETTILDCEWITANPKAADRRRR